MVFWAFAHAACAQPQQDLVLTSGTQKLWPHLSVLNLPSQSDSPDEAMQAWQQQGGHGLAHEQAQVGGWIPQARWARLRMVNPQSTPMTKVLVYPSTTQDDVQLWRHGPGGWQRVSRADAGTGWLQGAQHVHWILHWQAQEANDWLILVNGYNRVRFPLVLMPAEEHLQLEKNSAVMSVLLITLPLALVLMSLAYWPKTWSQGLVLMLAMAVSEWVGMLWVSGIGVWLMPWWDRWTWGWVGETAYLLLLGLGLWHARAVVAGVLPAWVSMLLSLLMGWWWLVAPGLALWAPWSLRFQLVWLGSAQALGLLVVALWAMKRQPTLQTRQMVMIWFIYLLSAVVYVLHRWMDWSAQVTLWANVVQGSAVAVVFAASIWQQVMAMRDEERTQLQRLHERQVWWAMLQHDLWQPLMSIRMAVHLLNSPEVVAKEEVMTSLQYATESLDDFAVIHAPEEAGTLQHEAASPPPVRDLKALVMRLVQEHRPMANFLSVSLRSHLLPLQVRVHEAELRRLVRNLFQNALRHTPAKGRILMAVRSQGGQAWLWIVDTGSGMPQALLASHVKPAHAQQASEHVGQSTERGGWGLGLYSANHIAHRQGWSLIFKSRLGHGTTVRIRLGPVIAEASGG